MASGLDRVTRQLLAEAERLHAEIEGEAGSVVARYGAFQQAYRDWLNVHHSVPGSPGERMERIRAVMMAMLAAPRLGEAIETLVRFGPLILGDISPASIGAQGEETRIVLVRARRDDAVGLIGELWALSLLLSQLEFLVGRFLTDVRGHVRHAPALPAGSVAMLFDRPLSYQGGTLQLIIPSVHLDRAITARPAQILSFMPRLVPAMLDEDVTGIDHASAVSTLLRTHLMRGGDGDLDFRAVALRLGCSVATLRRRLVAEGSSFRDIRAGVHDHVAKQWLQDRRISSAAIAERLGYADVFSFQRSFARLNGITPAVFRRRMAAPVG